MRGWRQSRGYCCRYAKCCFAIWVIGEGSSVGSAALGDSGIVGKLAESLARLGRKGARACSWMMVVDR